MSTKDESTNACACHSCHGFGQVGGYLSPTEGWQNKHTCPTCDGSGLRKLRYEVVKTMKETQIRIKWKIDQSTGHGKWHDASIESSLVQWTKAMNAKYGEGTHWIEVSDE